MTQPDIYTIEARRRLADANERHGLHHTAASYLDCRKDDTSFAPEIETLAATLRELNWQPPIDPDLLEAEKLAEDYKAKGWNACLVVAFLAAIKRGRELERGK